LPQGWIKIFSKYFSEPDGPSMPPSSQFKSEGEHKKGGETDVSPP